MKKFENLGKKLSKDEQKEIKGGVGDPGSCSGVGCGANGEDLGCDGLGHGCTCHHDPEGWSCRTGR